jgi:hypothetical protein
MNQAIFLRVIGSVLLAVSCMHLLRVVFNLEATIGGWAVPMWLSWLAIVFSGALSFMAFAYSRKS